MPGKALYTHLYDYIDPPWLSQYGHYIFIAIVYESQ